MATLMRSAVMSPVEVPKRSEAVAEQYSHRAGAASRWDTVMTVPRSRAA
jgi:hypothetical protein